ncbi:MAG TPA: hypothetical protein VHZ07_10210 [Bryobacteraceae bacterium]|jgi:predicted RNA polymerase sigma factor|nr:hypothetical protein [Bryobacteraceae bacterium]
MKDVPKAIKAVWKIESTRLIAAIARVTHDIGIQKYEEIARELEWQQQQLGDALEHSLDQVIDDDILRLILTACHPVLTVEARIGLYVNLGAVQSCETRIADWSRLIGTYRGSRDDSFCTVKRRSTPAVRMPFSVKGGRGGQRSFRRRPDHAP